MWALCWKYYTYLTWPKIYNFILVCELWHFSLPLLHFLLTILVVDLLRVWCHSIIVCCTVRRRRFEWWRYCNRFRCSWANSCGWRRRRLRLHTKIRALPSRRTSPSSAVRALGKEAEMERRLGQRVENCEKRGMGDEVEGDIGAGVERIWSACKQKWTFFYRGLRHTKLIAIIFLIFRCGRRCERRSGKQ